MDDGEESRKIEKGLHELVRLRDLHEMKAFIRVWAFKDAPEGLRELSDNGGDEDWLALVPPRFRDEWLGWLESERFGCAHVDKIELSDGWIVYIGCHS